MSDLNYWTDKYETARNAYDTNISQFEKNQKQYDGELQPSKGKETECLFNFTGELIESVIDSSVPQPKVEPLIPTERNKELANIIEDMCRAEAKRLKFEEKNDVDERITKIMGGDLILIEWDNSIKDNDFLGAVAARIVSPLQFIPQEGVFDKDNMDYLFLSFEDTKERIENRYGVNVDDESLDLNVTESTLANETVTQVICYYKNKSQGIGCFSWVGETILIDDEEYQARGNKVCLNCYRTLGKNQKQCICGSKKFENKNLKSEIIEEDILRSDGAIIPKEE